MEVVDRDAGIPLETSSIAHLKTATAGAEENSSAETIVRLLLDRAGLSRLFQSPSLAVLVGDGNWISFSFRMKTGGDVGSLGTSTTLRRTTRTLRQSNSKKSTWFRSKGSPCLHFEIIPAERLGEIVVRGHVDHADPWTHPVAHLLRDYLPAHGMGTHPAPQTVLAKLKPQPAK